MLLAPVAVMSIVLLMVVPLPPLLLDLLRLEPVAADDEVKVYFSEDFRIFSCAFRFDEDGLTHHSTAES
jgi:hypothetical protein